MKKTGKVQQRIILLVLFFFVTLWGVPGKTQTAQAAATLTRSAVVEYAKSYIGKVPYEWGGNSFETGMDCSGFVCGVYEHFGLNFWSYRTKIRNSPLVSNVGADLSLAEAGDILWFEGHVGIYTGKVNGTHYMVNETRGTYKGITDNVIYSPVSICSAELKGVLKVKALQGTSAATTYYAAAKNTDGTLAINDKAASSSANKSTMIGEIPEGAVCTVYADKTSGKWIWVEYNGVQGWAYSTYLVKVTKSLSNAVESAHPHRKYNKYSNGYIEWFGETASYTTTTVSPTCTKEGYTLTECTQCSYSQKSDVKAALGHNKVTDNAVASTCGKSGKTEGSHCSRCGVVFKSQTAIPATGNHHYGSGKITKQPTTTATGVKTYTCTVCGKTKTETLPKKQAETSSSTATGSSGTSASGTVVTSSKLVKTLKGKNYSVTIAKTKVTANGKQQKPKITVKYKGKTLKTKYYTVKYTNNKYTGLASATVKGKGSYAGKIPATRIQFVIKPKKMTAPTVKSVQGKLQLQWKAEKNVTGYQLQICKDKKCSSIAAQFNLLPSTTKVNILGLTKKKTYYVRTRAYKVIKGKTYCGKWSTAKSGKVK